MRSTACTRRLPRPTASTSSPPKSSKPRASTPRPSLNTRKALGKNPNAVNLHYKLGRALLQQSHDPAALEQAKKEFEAELGLNPADAVAEYQVAQILGTQGQKADSAAHYERAAKLRPDFPEALIAVAKVRSEAKKYDEAVALLEARRQTPAPRRDRALQT